MKKQKNIIFQNIISIFVKDFHVRFRPWCVFFFWDVILMHLMDWGWEYLCGTYHLQHQDGWDPLSTELLAFGVPLLNIVFCLLHCLQKLQVKVKKKICFQFLLCEHPVETGQTLPRNRFEMPDVFFPIISSHKGFYDTGILDFTDLTLQDSLNCHLRHFSKYIRPVETLSWTQSTGWCVNFLANDGPMKSLSFFFLRNGHWMII